MHRIGLVHEQYGRRFMVLEHRYGCRHVMRKLSSIELLVGSVSGKIGLIWRNIWRAKILMIQLITYLCLLNHLQ